MCSTPPASTISQAPRAISPAPAVTAVSAPAHMRSTAKPGTVCGMPARSATSRPSVRPWSPTWAVAAKMTSPIRSTGIPGLRRMSSRTTLTAMSSARVFQKIPWGPARPNAVRTPSTKTTSRRSMRSILRRALRFELAAEILQLPAVGGVRFALVLEQHRPARLELTVLARVEQAAIRAQPVTGRVDGVIRLVVVARVVLRPRQVGKVRDDEVDRLAQRLEQGFVHDLDPGGHPQGLGGSP